MKRQAKYRVAEDFEANELAACQHAGMKSFNEGDPPIVWNSYRCEECGFSFDPTCGGTFTQAINDWPSHVMALHEQGKIHIKIWDGTI